LNIENMKIKSIGFCLAALAVSSLLSKQSCNAFSADTSQSIHYQVKANGKMLYVYDAPSAAYTFAEVNGKTQIEVCADRDVKWVDIRPFRLGIKARWKDSTIWFSIDQPCHLSIELNGNPLTFPLFFFADASEKNSPESSGPGVIYFEGGRVHKAGIIRPVSNQTIYIARGAIVEGSIDAKNVENVKICGSGILSGTGNDKSDNWNHYRMIRFADSKNITIQGITLVDSHTWQIVPENCENVFISGIRIISDNPSDDGIDIVRSRHVKILNCFIRTKDDCIAIKGHLNYPDTVITDDIHISGCTFWNAAWGNGIDIGFELQCNEVKNITVKNCDFIHVDKGAVISIHNGDKARVSNVLFEDIRIEDCNQKLFDLSIFYNRYGVDRPNTQEESDRRYLNGAWDGVLYLSPAEKKEHAIYRGYIENINFRNIYITDGIFPFSLFCGYDANHMVKNITIENLQVKGKKITSREDAHIYCEFAEGIKVL